MAQQHPMIPPSEELVASMIEQAFGPLGPAGLSDKNKLTVAFADFATRAARWGADQELEACLAQVSLLNGQALADRVRTARRPKPLSLKEQAKQALFRFDANVHVNADEMQDDFDLIRRALEQLP